MHCSPPASSVCVGLPWRRASSFYKARRILDIPQIGGIFLAVAGSIYNRFRYNEVNEDDDVQLCWWWRGQGGRCGYVKRLEAWHYESTDGQWERYPDYFLRRVLEGGRAY